MTLRPAATGFIARALRPKQTTGKKLDRPEIFDRGLPARFGIFAAHGLGLSPLPTLGSITWDPRPRPSGQLRRCS